MTDRVWKFNSDLLTGPCIGVVFELELLLLPVYVLCTINFDLTIDSNYCDKPYAAFISTTSLVWIGSLFKYEYLSHQETINIIW